MSWISDVRHQVRSLDLAVKNLRKFGWTVGGVFGLITVWGMYKHWTVPWLTTFGVIGLGLIITALVAPGRLKWIYRGWMGLGFGMGWIVSRLLLIIVFFLVVTPIGLIARLWGHKFLDLGFPSKKTSLWVPRGSETSINYEKMF